MIRPQRTIHRLAWLLLTPLLLGLILVFSGPRTDPGADHTAAAELPGEAAGKGVLP